MTKLSAHRCLTCEAQGCCVVGKPHFDQDLIIHLPVFGQTVRHENFESLSTGAGAVTALSNLQAKACHARKKIANAFYVTMTPFPAGLPVGFPIDGRIDDENEREDFSWDEQSPVKSPLK